MEKDLITVEGKGGIKATVIADSISKANKRITTFELEFHRYVLSEFNTHRMISKNAASSRAIPVEKNIEMIRQRTAMPIHWGKNQPGMSAKEECNEPATLQNSLMSREEAWLLARENAIEVASAMHRVGYHKQIVNRLLEPFTFIKVVATATEWDNFFHLRRHPDAQPEIHELANCVWDVYQHSTPNLLEEGEWHVPYYGDGYWKPGFGDILQDALKISASCCAQTSFRKSDDSLDKARRIYNKLVESKPAHASPFEHQATPIDASIDSAEMWVTEGGYLDDPRFGGVTHTDGKKIGSGNFWGWTQHRQMIPDHVCNNYRPGDVN